MFDLIGRTVAWFYSLSGDYAMSIVLLTLLIMVIFTPLTLKGTKSMMAMQELQPEIKRLQAEHRDDRQKLNEEMMRLYQANGVNPLGGCLPSLVQLPVFFVLYRVINGLTRRVGGDGEDANLFNPDHISVDSDLYRDLSSESEMTSFGVDLARSANDVLRSDFVEALPYLGLVFVTFLLAWFQQRQMRSRRGDAAPANPQMEVLMKIMPFMLPVFAFVVQAALAVYFIASSLWRIGQQAFIHKTMPMPVGAGGAAIDVESKPVAKPSPAEQSPKTRKTAKGQAGRTGQKGSSASRLRPTRDRDVDSDAARARRERSERRRSGGAAPRGSRSPAKGQGAKRSGDNNGAARGGGAPIESRRTAQNRPKKKKKR